MRCLFTCRHLLNSSDLLFKMFFLRPLRMSNFSSRQRRHFLGPVPPVGTGHSQTQRRRRQRHIIWYNPPYSKSVKTNIAHDFLQLIDKHFPRNNRLHKLFNRHTVRVSYSCSENMKTYIKRHNNKILKRNDSQDNPPNTNSTHPCNCRNPMKCPVKGNCLQSSVLYEARAVADLA